MMTMRTTTKRMGRTTTTNKCELSTSAAGALHEQRRPFLFRNKHASGRRWLCGRGRRRGECDSGYEEAVLHRRGDVGAHRVDNAAHERQSQAGVNPRLGAGRVAAP